MKFFIVLALVASATAVPYGGIVNTGASAVSRSEDGHGNYAFGYNEDHATGGTFRKEKGGPGVQVGSYGLRDADGRIRTVNYVADALGFRASVSSNEPGVDAHQPAAATTLNGNAPVIPALAAPVIASHGAQLVGAPLVSAPLVGAPLIGKSWGAAPLAVGPLASYSVATQHISAGPVIAKAAWGAGPVLAASPYGIGKY